MSTVWLTVISMIHVYRVSHIDDSCICSIWRTVTVISCQGSHSQTRYVLFICMKRDMTHPHVWHDSSTCVTWLICMCEITTGSTHLYVRMPHLYVRMPREALICMCECLIPRHGKQSNETWYDAFICMNHVGDTSHPYARHDASIFKNHVCDTSHPQWIMCVRVDTSHPYVIKWIMCVRHSHQWIMCATRLSPMCATRRINMYESCLRHVPSMCHLLQHACATRLIHWIMFTTRRIHVAHMNEPCLIHVILNHACDTFHPCVRHVASNESCVCDASHPCVRYDTLICATGLIHTCAMTLSHSG